MGRTTTQMELVSITKLVPYVNNARTHSPNGIKLRKSHITKNVVWDFFVKFYMNMY